MNDFTALQKSIAESIVNSEENFDTLLPDKSEKKVSKRVIHKLFLKRKKARKVAKLSRRKNRK